MTSIAKLKDRARKHEQKEDWQAAIEAYQKVLEAEEGEDDLELELGLYNRIGDLYLRLGQTDDAVSYYEQAADKYSEAGFFNNAIALCNKALRHRPERPQVYLKLSRLCAEQGFVTDARRWILDYAQRQVRAGRVDAALSGLLDFVATSSDPDVREFLAQQLAAHGRADEAAQQYAHAHGERMERGETEAAERAAKQARAIDPAIDLDAVRASAPARDHGGGIPGLDDSDLGIEPTGIQGLETRQDHATGEPEVAGLEGLESTGGATAGEEAGEAGEMDGLEVSYTERGSEVDPGDVEDAEALGGLETFGGDEEEAPGEEEEAEPLPMLDSDFPEEEEAAEEEAEPLPMMEFGEEEEAAAAAVQEEEVPETVEEEAEAAVEEEDIALDLDLGAVDFGDLGTEKAEVPEALELPEPAQTDINVEAVIRRSQELVSRDLTAEALRELSLLSGADAPPAAFRKALSVVNEIVRRNGDDVGALQQRVEFSSRTEDKELLIRAYLDFAAALGRLGADTKAQVMYERVLGLDAKNAVALEALGIEAAPAEEETVDLAAILQEMEPEEVGDPAPAPDAGGDQAFAAMLSEFQARVKEQAAGEDAGDHYDLGLAFKEMGLIDEAIAEFQTALTGGEERLKVYEELGQCYILKGQFNVALKIFNRALQVPHQDPADLLGVYYHLGQCHEELGQRDRAREAYEKVLAISPAFQDVPDRMARL